MSRNFDNLFREIVTVLRRDYAGKDLMGSRFDPRYYNQAIGQAWHDGKLDELLLLRYISQMLACIGDRSLRLTLAPGEDYTPWSPGFFTTRCDDSLYVTAVTGETRLRVGDRITKINRGTPSHHRLLIQKNFFYADVPEREDWNGMLKMADTVTVERDGKEEELPLEHHPVEAPARKAAFSMRDGIAVLCPGVLDDSGTVEQLIGDHEAELREARALLVDVRGCYGDAEYDFLPLLPYLCKGNTPLDDLLDTDYATLYTPRNCELWLAENNDTDGEYAAALKKLQDLGMTDLRLETGEIIEGRRTIPTAVLTDGRTRDAAETLAQCARRSGVPLVGRATLGTQDFTHCVHYALDDRYTLTWPTAVTKAALDGHGTCLHGIIPDSAVPWTPAEFTGDPVFDAAVRLLKL